MNKSPIAIVVAVFLLGVPVLSACDREDPNAIQNRVELETFESCGELEGYIQDTAIRHMEITIDSYIESYKRYYNGPHYSKDAGAVGASADASSSGSTKKDEGPASTTKTNTQVLDVDEPDFMKNDGTRIFVLSGQKLYIAKSWPVSSMSLQASIDIGGYPLNMFLDKNRVVVLSRVSIAQTTSGNCIGSGTCADSYGNALKVMVLDVADIANPKVKSEFYFPGSYTSARRVGSSVRLVLTSGFRYPNEMKWYPEYDAALFNDKDRLIEALEALKGTNAKAIRARPLAQWLSGGKVKVSGGKEVDLPYQCTDFYRPNASVEMGLTTVVTLNLDAPDAEPSRSNILGLPSTVYASKSSLYLASRHWWWSSSAGTRSHTYLHKFDITDPNTSKYVASGGLDGTFLNQFSLDEFEGYLRVATTATVAATESEATSSWSGSTTTVNRISVLNENAGRLEVIGKTEDLARGERIYSVRFMGDRGFVVTYRQVDPLYTLDLSEPTAPRVVGELKVPGYSTYLHPVDGKTLLALGVNTTSGSGYLKLALFDVSDFTKPKERFTVDVGSWSGYSEAASEHKAFNYFSERKLLAIPFSDYSSSWSSGDYWTSFVSDLRVFSVDAQKGIKLKGSLNMTDLYKEHDDSSWGWGNSPWIRRSVMSADTNGVEYAYAVSDVGIRVAAVSDLSTTLQTVKFKSSSK